LLHSDEGLGDTIQFSRYASLVAEQGARVILEVQTALHGLLSGIEGVSLCLPKSASSLPDFDLHCPLSSLPLAFGTRLETIPSMARYVPAPPAALMQSWEARLGSHDRLRVGLVWSGNPVHLNDHNRSISLQRLSAILDADAIFISLQKDPRPDDRATLLARTDIVDLTEELTSFVETAALISCLDLVITVDTSVAHLAGALGRPTWILLRRTTAGCSIATTAPGIRRCGFSGRARPANMAEFSNGCTPSCKPWSRRSGLEQPNSPAAPRSIRGIVASVRRRSSSRSSRASGADAYRPSSR
jgi:hypothetical protein